MSANIVERLWQPEDSRFRATGRCHDFRAESTPLEHQHSPSIKVGLAHERNSGPFVKHAQSGRLWSGEPAEEQGAFRRQGATQRRREMPEWLLQDIRDYQVETRTPIVRRFMAEVDRHRMRVQGRVRFGRRQRKRIDVGAYDELSASGSGNSGEHSRSRSYVQNRCRLPLSAKEVHRTGAEARSRMGSVPECGSACYFLMKLGKRQPTFFHRRGW
jgi:hypothetical protein